MEAPLITKLSRYKSTPKWTIAASRSRSAAPLNVRGTRGPASYYPNHCFDKTSKFRQISYACSFGTSKRFSPRQSDARSMGPGPGQYSPPSDYSHTPYTACGNITFGVGRVNIPGGRRNKDILPPGPGDYDIRGKHRLGGSTMDSRGVHVNHRHGWYFDTELKSCKDIPSPGTYDPHFPHEKSDKKVSFGSGERPPAHHSAAIGIPSPGQYDIPSSLSGRSFSFTRGVTKPRIRQEVTVGPLCGQPTQFG